MDITLPMLALIFVCQGGQPNSSQPATPVNCCAAAALLVTCNPKCIKTPIYAGTGRPSQDVYLLRDWYNANCKSAG